MLLYWYTCISINTYHYVIYYISLETVWWALPNTSLIIQIHLVIHEILAKEDFIVTDGLISCLFVVAFVYPCYRLKLKVLSNRTTLILSNTRELDRVSSTK